MKVVGWTGAYTSGYESTPFTQERKQALIECIRRRHYNFTHFNHEFMEYCAPMYEDNKICILTKPQFDDVMNTVYSDIPLGHRLMPLDVIKRDAINNVLYEKADYEPKGDK